MAVFLSGNTQGVEWLIWKLDEEVETLKFLLGNDYLQELDKYRTEKRQKEFLASRIALNTLFGDSVTLTYASSGKPYIETSGQEISISHSGEYVVVARALSPFGVDIEKISDKLDRTKHKFCTEEELQHLLENQYLMQLGTIWSAKESMYKAIGDYPFLFDKELITKIDTLDSQGNFPAEAIINKKKSPFKIHYTQLVNYIFTIAVKI